MYTRFQKMVLWTTFSAICVNIGILMYANWSNNFELQIISILNMILLSCVLLREDTK